MSKMINLEPLCAEYGMKLVEVRRVSNTAKTDCENVINKGLGILVENGFYALAVFLLSYNKKDYGKDVLRILMEMLCDERIGLMNARFAGDVQQDLAAIREVTEELPRLMLARRLAENALTFGRYHCKAIKD